MVPSNATWWLLCSPPPLLLALLPVPKGGGRNSGPSLREPPGWWERPLGKPHSSSPQRCGELPHPHRRCSSIQRMELTSTCSPGTAVGRQEGHEVWSQSGDLTFIAAHAFSYEKGKLPELNTQTEKFGEKPGRLRGSVIYLYLHLLSSPYVPGTIIFIYHNCFNFHNPTKKELCDPSFYRCRK